MVAKTRITNSVMSGTFVSDANMNTAGWQAKNDVYLNRLILLAAQIMTCSNSSTIPLLTTIPTEMRFSDEELSNLMFLSDIRLWER